VKRFKCQKNLRRQHEQIPVRTIDSLDGHLGLAVFHSTLHAQTLSSTAALSGTVSDPAARVQKATVKLTDSEKGVARTSRPFGRRIFIRLLPAGAYTLEASAPNFKTSRQDGIVLHAGILLLRASV